MGNLMDQLQQQIGELEGKVDQLHYTVEQLSGQIATLTLKQRSDSQSDTAAAQLAPTPIHKRFNSAMEHKDILVDGSSWEGDANEGLSPDTQIRRLTAQLTAAYNRIATLEEQLFDCRIHS